MRMRKLSLRAVLSAVVAVVFAIAAEPGAMAMPAPHHPATMMMDSQRADSGAMSCTDMPGCDHMKLPKDKEAPCKSMAVCAGMMGCYGMAAVAVDWPQLRTKGLDAPVHFHPQTSLGLTLQPDNPPPIV